MAEATLDSKTRSWDSVCDRDFSLNEDGVDGLIVSSDEAPESSEALHGSFLGLVEAFIDRVDPLADPIAGSAIEEYRTRVEAGDAPVPLPMADRVAQFVEGQFAPRRFTSATP